MRIVVNHLTRMKTRSRICVAGVDETTYGDVRAVTGPDDLLTRGLLSENGGPFQVGAVVDLGAVTPDPRPPESEDHRFETGNAQFVERVAPERYWELLDDIHSASIGDALGPELQQRGRGYALEAGHGTRSLAVVPVPYGSRLATNPWGKLRLSFADDSGADISLSVTDVRFSQPDHVTFQEDVVADVAERLRQGVEAFMMVGLARAFTATNDDRERHWVQVNGLCLADRPLGP